MAECTVDIARPAQYACIAELEKGNNERVCSAKFFIRRPTEPRISKTSAPLPSKYWRASSIFQARVSSGRTGDPSEMLGISFSGLAHGTTIEKDALGRDVVVITIHIDYNDWRSIDGSKFNHCAYSTLPLFTSALAVVQVT